MEQFKPSVIYLDSNSAHDFVAHQILDHFTDVPVVPVHNYLSAWVPEPRQNSLLLTHNRGKFVRPCPATKNYLCCCYQILDFAAGCNQGCSYCILQAYLDFPGLVFYTNWDEMWGQLRHYIENRFRQYTRLGTGEFTDSLLFEEIVNLTQYLIPRLVEYDNIMLELKTKTNNIQNLRDIDHKGQVMVSWSLNTPKIIAEEESNTVSLSERLKAAAQCQEWGYKLGFHFDPLIYYQNWEEDYLRVVDEIFAEIDPEKIVFISLGCLRFMPPLFDKIRTGHPQSKIIWEEFILGDDGKMRYFKPLRIKIYSKLVERIKRYAPQILIYLCMESPGVWQEVFGFAPQNNLDLKQILDERCNG